MDPFETWKNTIIDELLKRALTACPTSDPAILRTTLETDVAPALEKERSTLFFYLGSHTEWMTPKTFVDALLKEALAREQRGNDVTNEIPVWGNNDLSGAKSLAGLAHDVVEEIIELTEDDLEPV